MTATSEFRILLGPDDVSLSDVLHRLGALRPWRPFDQRLVEFVARLSRNLLADPRIREFPELAALGHWFRKARLMEMARTHGSGYQGGVRLGRGLAFHIAPANVDSVFMYSWLLSLLAGNSNIVRVSQNASPQQALLVNLLRGLCADNDFADVAARIVLVTYPHEREITRQLSQACAVRLVWGGDATVDEIRSIHLRPTATELCFPDRFSLAAINASAILELDEKALLNLVHGFYNDAFWFAQQACSSPRMVTWIGEPGDVKLARDRFWPVLAAEVVRRHPENSSAMVMSRLGAAFESAAALPAVPALSTALAAYPLVLNTNCSDFGVLRYTHCGNGFFFQQTLEALIDLAPRLTDKDQTLSVFGFGTEQIADFISQLPARAIDRIVPIGKALDFDVIWDGQDFISSLTRQVVVSA